MATRRTFLVTTTASLSPAFAFAGVDDDCDGRGKFRSSDPDTSLAAPSTLARQGSGEIRTLDQGASTPSQSAAAISSNFQLIAEQNFRNMKPVDLRRLLNQLSNAELNDFAFFYNRSALNSGRPELLLDIIASKGDASAIGRIADHFGFEAVYAAVYRVNPKQAYSLTSRLSPTQQRATSLAFLSTAALAKRPVPAAQRKLDTGAAAVQAAVPPPLNVDATLGEIYSSFRTAPAGALSVQGALYETAVFAGQRVAGAYAFGYAIGTGINSLWSTYAPESYAASSDVLGHCVDNFVNDVQNLMNGNAFESLSQSVQSAIGYLQSTFFGAFVPGGPRAAYYTNGGDFGVSSAWGRNELNSCK